MLVSGVGPDGVDALLAALACDSSVIRLGTSPPAIHPLLAFYKFAVLLESPHLLQFLGASHLFYFSYTGFDGGPPPYNYVPEADPDNFILTASRARWVGQFWSLFTHHLQRQKPGVSFYAGRVPPWLSSELRQVLSSFSVYCFQDPRDVWLSAKRQVQPARGTKQVLDDCALARNIALEFLQNFENYFAERSRSNVSLIGAEELTQDPAALCRSMKNSAEINTVDDHDPNSIPAVQKLKSSLQGWKQNPVPNEVMSLLLSTVGDEMAWLRYETAMDSIDRSRTIRFDNRALNVSKFSIKQARLEPQDDFTLVHVRGRDCHLVLPFEPFEADAVKNIWVSVNTEVGEVCSIYWRSADKDFSEERVVYQRLSPNQHWTVLSFPVHKHPQWKGNIAELRLDLFNVITRGWLRRWRSPYPAHRGVGRIRWVKLVP